MPARMDVYMTVEQKKLILEISEKTGKSVADLLLNGFSYWLKRNPEKVKRLATELERSVKIKKIKEKERQSGDFLGSFEKYESKVKRAREAFRKGRLNKEEYRTVVSEATKDHEITRNLWRKSRGLEER